MDLVSHFIIILKQIIDHRLPRDYDYHRIPAPWIQEKILDTLSYLGAGNEEVSKSMYDIITTVLKRSDDSASNVGYALVYQCLRTITKIHPSKELLDLATLTISRFLNSQSKNLKYMGIVGLI
jgi:AP-4 complex subunit epsilon-1